MSEFMDRAKAEAENELARRREVMWQAEGETLSHSWGLGFERGFAEGAAWADEQGASTLPEKFRDPTALARFIIENEWALDSESDPNIRADWNETLNRVCDNWDGQTPDDIVSTIAAAVRLDRSFRAAEQEPTDEEVEAAAYELYRRSYRMTWVSWDQLRPYVKTPFRSAGRAALRAAQKVRAGQ